MDEVEWVKTIVAPSIQKRLQEYDPNLSLRVGYKLPYAYEIGDYENDEACENRLMRYETDLLVVENSDKEKWIPRVVIEAKGNGAITTHDAITYSHKAATHRQVHPYLRYGILLGDRKHYPLPGRLFRHGTQFDFMISWVKHEPRKQELDDTVDVLRKEVDASRILEKIIYDSRKKGKDHYTVLHKELKLRSREEEQES
jgi:hypothetical protein